MRIQGRWLVAAAAGVFLFGGVESLLAASAPAILSSSTSRDTATNRVVVTILGTSLTKLGGFGLFDLGDNPVPGTIDTVLRSKSTLVLMLPAGNLAGAYNLKTAIKTAAGPTLLLKFGGTTASGAFSTALGQGTTASGDYSTAFGSGTTASDQYSTAMGYGSTASGTYTTATGVGTVASGFASTAIGNSAHATGYGSVAIGTAAFSTGFYTTAMGDYTTAQAYGSLVLGQYNVIAGNANAWTSTDPVLVVGNGDNNTPSNAFTLLNNGNLTIAGTLTQNSDERLKRDVAPLAGVLRRIAAIRGVTYRMRDEARGPAGTQIGLLAQEVRAVFPELVHEDTQGTLSVAYGNFSAVLLEAVKEQQAVLDSRDAELAALKRQLAEEHAATEKRLSRLEALLGESTAPATGR